MRLLLDTQIALWALTGSGRLGVLAQGLIEDPIHEIFISAASVSAIKYAPGRGDMPISGIRAAELFAQAGYRELPITGHHAAMVDTLPTIHGDLFDRILIAQALTEPMRLLSRDATLASYGVIVMPV